MRSTPTIAALTALPALSLAGAAAQDTGPQSITFAAAQPSSAVTVPADFVGVGFDGAFLTAYSNDFSQNLVEALGARMSIAPKVRIGGTSADRLTYDPNQTEATKCLKGPCPFGSGAYFSVGPTYFDGFKSFPNSAMTFQAPMAAKLNVSNDIAIVQNAYKVLGAARTDAIALGNEVGGFEDTAEDYVSGVKTLEAAIVKALGLTGKDTRIFEVLDLASEDVTAGNKCPDAFKAGLDDNKQAKIAAEHWYQVDGETKGAVTLQGNLMNHTAITSKFKQYAPSLTYLAKNNAQLPYILSETGSALGHNTDTYSASFGAALWAVDFKLYAMSQGVARVHGTQRPQAAHSLWNPISGVTDSPGPQVRGPFYAEAFVADFIGKTNGTTGVVGMDLGSDFFTAYGAYEEGKLARVALVNLREWNESDGARPKKTFAVQVPKGVASVKVASLQADAGALSGGFDVDGKNITWAGVQWAKKLGNGKDYGTTVMSTVPVTNGAASIDVADSEAVIVHL